MTNIDHDVLARRIAERLGLSGYLRDAKRTNGVWGMTRKLVEQSIASTLREALPTSEETCDWIQQDTIFGVDWVTECGAEFRIDDGMPTENGMKHCCFCGKKLIEVPFEEDDDFES